MTLQKYQPKLTKEDKNVLDSIKKHFWNGDYNAIDKIIDSYQDEAEEIADNGCSRENFERIFYVIKKAQDAYETLTLGA